MENQQHLISVIVPVYKVEPYIRKCIDSILAQTYINLEIILVDDGSPDRCPEICDEYASRDSRIKVIHKENGGLSDARNKGLEVASGDYIAFVDSDDWIEADMYEILLRNMQYFDADISVGGVADDLEENGCYHTIKISNYGESDFFENKVEAMKRYFINSWAAWDKLYKRNVFDKIRFPIGEINEDEAIVLYVLNECSCVCYTNKVLYHYMKRMTGKSITMAPFQLRDLAWKKNCENNLRYIREKYPILEEYAAKRYRSSLMWHIIKISLLKDCSMYRNEIKSIMNELRTEVSLFRKIPFDNLKSKIQFEIAMCFGFYIFRLFLRLKRGLPL